MGWIAWIARNSTFFGFTGGKEDEHRGRFDVTGLREGENDHSMIFPVCAREAERRFTGGRRTPFGGDQIFLFF